MTMKEIPKKIEHTCDCCGKVEITKYTDSPRYWDTVAVYTTGYDDGMAVGGFEDKKEFCGKCHGNFKVMFKKFMSEGRD